MNFDLRQLRYFIAVAEEQHVGRAAVRLNMTQPPLSQAIQALETALGASLFIRQKRGISISAAGQALLPEARRLIKDTEALPELVQSAAQGETGQLALAFVSSADYNLLPPLLRDFRIRYPKVLISLREATSDIQLEALRLGQIDVGIMIPPLPDKLTHLLHYRPILLEPLILAVPSDASWLERASAGNDMTPSGASAGTTARRSGRPRLSRHVSLQACQDMPLIIFPRAIAPAFYDTILGCFLRAGITPVIGQEAIQMQTIIGLVSAGMGIALVPQSVSNLKRPGVAYYAIKEMESPLMTPQIETGIAWRQDNHSPVLQAFINLISNPDLKLTSP